MSTKQTGEIGEKVACYYLEKKGYKILERNFAKKWTGGPIRGELDIIAEKDKAIFFIEVKTSTIDSQREQSLLMGPEQRVNYLKQEKIIKMAQVWLNQNKIPLDSKWQIDVISIEIDLKVNRAKIRRFPNVVAL